MFVSRSGINFYILLLHREFKKLNAVKSIKFYINYAMEFKKRLFFNLIHLSDFLPLRLPDFQNLKKLCECTYHLKSKLHFIFLQLLYKYF